MNKILGKEKIKKKNLRSKGSIIYQLKILVESFNNKLNKAKKEYLNLVTGMIYSSYTKPEKRQRMKKKDMVH